jgi:hypothetical protein
MIRRFLTILIACIACGASIGMAVTVKASPTSAPLSIKAKSGNLELGATAGAGALLAPIESERRSRFLF